MTSPLADRVRASVAGLQDTVDSRHTGGSLLNLGSVWRASLKQRLSVADSAAAPAQPTAMEADSPPELPRRSSKAASPRLSTAGVEIQAARHRPVSPSPSARSSALSPSRRESSNARRSVSPPHFGTATSSSSPAGGRGAPRGGSSVAGQDRGGGARSSHGAIKGVKSDLNRTPCESPNKSFIRLQSPSKSASSSNQHPTHSSHKAELHARGSQGAPYVAAAAPVNPRPSSGSVLSEEIRELEREIRSSIHTGEDSGPLGGEADSVFPEALLDEHGGTSGRSGGSSDARLFNKVGASQGDSGNSAGEGYIVTNDGTVGSSNWRSVGGSNRDIDHGSSSSLAKRRDERLDTPKFELSVVRPAWQDPNSVDAPAADPIERRSIACPPNIKYEDVENWTSEPAVSVKKRDMIRLSAELQAVEEELEAAKVESWERRSSTAAGSQALLQIQAFWRGQTARRSFDTSREAALSIQTAWRSYSARRKLDSHKLDRQMETVMARDEAVWSTRVEGMSQWINSVRQRQEMYISNSNKPKRTKGHSLFDTGQGLNEPNRASRSNKADARLRRTSPSRSKSASKQTRLRHAATSEGEMHARESSQEQTTRSPSERHRQRRRERHERDHVDFSSDASPSQPSSPLQPLAKVQIAPATPATPATSATPATITTPAPTPTGVVSPRSMKLTKERTQADLVLEDPPVRKPKDPRAAAAVARGGPWPRKKAPPPDVPAAKGAKTAKAFVSTHTNKGSPTKRTVPRVGGVEPGEYVGYRNKNGLFQGFGMLRSDDGTTYSGQFVAGSREGQGTLFFEGGVFEGEWQDGCAEGQGTIYFKNGDTFKGSYVRNKKHGAGTYTWTDGAVETGAYRHGCKEGWHAWQRGDQTWDLLYEAGVVVTAQKAGVLKVEANAARKISGASLARPSDARKIKKNSKHDLAAEEPLGEVAEAMADVTHSAPSEMLIRNGPARDAAANGGTVLQEDDHSLSNEMPERITNDHKLGSRKTIAPNMYSSLRNEPDGERSFRASGAEPKTSDEAQSEVPCWVRSFHKHAPRKSASPNFKFGSVAAGARSGSTERRPSKRDSSRGSRSSLLEKDVASRNASRKSGETDELNQQRRLSHQVPKSGAIANVSKRTRSAKSKQLDVIDGSATFVVTTNPQLGHTSGSEATAAVSVATGAGATVGGRNVVDGPVAGASNATNGNDIQSPTTYF